jgi:hypothetical protein
MYRLTSHYSRRNSFYWVVSFVLISPRPSIGFPTPSTTLPKYHSPTPIGEYLTCRLYSHSLIYLINWPQESSAQILPVSRSRTKPLIPDSNTIISENFALLSPEIVATPSFTAITSPFSSRLSCEIFTESICFWIFVKSSCTTDMISNKLISSKIRIEASQLDIISLLQSRITVA